MLPNRKIITILHIHIQRKFRPVQHHLKTESSRNEKFLNFLILHMCACGQCPVRFDPSPKRHTYSHMHFSRTLSNHPKSNSIKPYLITTMLWFTLDKICFHWRKTTLVSKLFMCWYVFDKLSRNLMVCWANVSKGIPCMCEIARSLSQMHRTCCKETAAGSNIQATIRRDDSHRKESFVKLQIMQKYRVNHQTHRNRSRNTEDHGRTIT